MHLDGRNTAVVGLWPGEWGSGFYSRERAPRKPTARPPSDSSRDWLVHVSIPRFQDSARCRRRDSRPRDVPRAGTRVSSLSRPFQERESAEPRLLLAGDEFFANSWINALQTETFLSRKCHAFISGFRGDNERQAYFQQRVREANIFLLIIRGTRTIRV